MDALLRHLDVSKFFRSKKFFEDFVNIFFEKLAKQWSASPEQVDVVKEVFIDCLKQVGKVDVIEHQVDNEETNIPATPRSEDEKPPNISVTDNSFAHEIGELENCDPSESELQTDLLHGEHQSTPDFGGVDELEAFSEEESQRDSSPAGEPEAKKSGCRRSKRLEKAAPEVKQEPKAGIEDDFAEKSDESYSCEDDDSSGSEDDWGEGGTATQTSKKHSVRRKKRLHLRIVHEVDAEGFIQCSNCQAKFAVEKFFDHTKEVHGFDEVDVQCPDCPKILVSRIGFSSHRRGKHGPGKECPVCAKSIPSSKTAYKKHLKTHNMHRCQYCGEEISDSSDHVEREHGAKVGCPVCKEDIPERILDGHVKAHSNPKQGCLKCGMCFQSHMGWMKHNRQVHMGRPLDECVLCGKKFPGLYFLKVHMKDSHSQEKTDVCKVCGQAFRKRVSLQSHMLFKHGSKTRCVVCSTLVPDSKLSEHMEDHEKGKQHTCKKCGQTFIRATLLRSHLHQHTPKVICTICGKEVKTNHLRPHLQKHSTVRVKCNQCGREYKNEVTLKVHIRYSHTKRKERPLLLCQSCGKGFREQFKLKQHQLTHGEPKCQCPDCPKKFVTEQQMRKHAKKHTRSRQFEFECSRCLKVFAFAKNLQYHVDTAHLGIRPHACPQCPERFKHVLGLRHHVKVVHDGSGKQGTSKAKKVRSKNSKASDQPAKNVGDVPSEPNALDANKRVVIPDVSLDFDDLN